MDERWMQRWMLRARALTTTTIATTAADAAAAAVVAAAATAAAAAAAAAAATTTSAVATAAPPVVAAATARPTAAVAAATNVAPTATTMETVPLQGQPLGWWVRLIPLKVHGHRQELGGPNSLGCDHVPHGCGTGPPTQRLAPAMGISTLN